MDTEEHTSNEYRTPKVNEITISITLNGSEVSREMNTESLEYLDALLLGNMVIDMLNTLQEEDKHFL